MQAGRSSEVGIRGAGLRPPDRMLKLKDDAAFVELTHRKRTGELIPPMPNVTAPVRLGTIAGPTLPSDLNRIL